MLDTVAENVIARLVGPMSLRFVFQPLVAVLLGIRDGAMDAKAGEPPFIIDLIVDRDNRRAKLAGVLKSLSKTIVIATVFDMIAQHLIFDQVRVIPAIIVGVFLLSVPYSLARGITNRIVSARRSDQSSKSTRL
ncbi:MAG TPA: hypothetical protein PLQ49_09465 [Methanothrix sp.]|nr:hypothetical protein [Methanothrix sp.]HRW83030.1 hypothetical protein [Methanothrix sp.]